MGSPVFGLVALRVVAASASASSSAATSSAASAAISDSPSLRLASSPGSTVLVAGEEVVAVLAVDVDFLAEGSDAGELVVDEPGPVPASADADDSDVDELDSAGLAQATP
jgi:hypothetical protein